MTLCEVRDGKKPLSNKQIAHKLEQIGFLEKRGKTNAVHYILPRRYYELAGDTAAYSLATDWDIDQVWAVIKPFLLKYNEAKRAELNTLIGNHVSEKQKRNYIEQFYHFFCYIHLIITRLKRADKRAELRAEQAVESMWSQIPILLQGRGKNRLSLRHE